MPKEVSERQLQLVRDCITYRLSQEESLKYCETMGHEISLSTLKRTKNFVMSDPAIQQWLNEYASVGFAVQHRQSLDEIEKLQTQLWRMFVTETSKPDVIVDPAAPEDQPIEERRRINNPNKNKFLILRLSERLEELTKTKASLNLGNPVIAAIKQKLAIQVAQGGTKDAKDLSLARI